MNLHEMSMFVEGCKGQLNEALHMNPSPLRQKTIREVVVSSVREAGSAFEEQCLIENFKETYLRYLEEVQAKTA